MQQIRSSSKVTKKGYILDRKVAVIHLKARLKKIVFLLGVIMKEDAHKRIRRLLSKDYIGYVLITCRPPTNDGGMQVEMTYSEGDPVLVSYLLDGARGYLDEEECDVGMELLS